MELKQYNLFFLYQETFALTKRLFIQLKRRPSTLLAGILQPIIWLFLFGALFSKAPEGFLPGALENNAPNKKSQIMGCNIPAKRVDGLLFN